MLSERFVEALDFARMAHGEQCRKGGPVTYVSHLLAVSALTLDAGGDEDLAIAALLHDVVEDTSVELSEIAERFGDRVAKVVEGCSDYMGDDPDNKPPWEDRKRAYVEHLEHVDEDTLTVSLADKQHNAWTLANGADAEGVDFWDRFTATPQQALWYYGAVLEVFERRPPEGRTSQLSQAVAAMAEVQKRQFASA